MCAADRLEPSVREYYQSCSPALIRVLGYVKAADILISMNEVSLDKFEKTLKPGGVLVINSSLCSEGRRFRDDVRVIRVPASEIANSMNNPRGTNIVMLGAAVRASGQFDCAEFRNSVDSFFAKKGKNNPLNARCFDEGAKLAG